MQDTLTADQPIVGQRLKVRITDVCRQTSLPDGFLPLLNLIEDQVVWLDVLNERMEKILNKHMTYRYTMNCCMLRFQTTMEYYRAWRLFYYEVIG